MPYSEQGRRLRLLRQALGFDSAMAFSAYMKWSGTAAISQFENGKRQVPIARALQIREKVPGFDPVWLWTGETRGLSFDLARRIAAEEAKEHPPKRSNNM